MRGCVDPYGVDERMRSLQDLTLGGLALLSRGIALQSYFPFQDCWQSHLDEGVRGPLWGSCGYAVPTGPQEGCCCAEVVTWDCSAIFFVLSGLLAKSSG